MKNKKIKKLSITVFLIVIINFIHSEAISQNCGGTNKITNPGFETGTTTGWSTYNATITVVSSPVHSGTKSCLVSNREDQYDGINRNIFSTGMESEKLYCFSAWVRYQTKTRGLISAVMEIAYGAAKEYYTISYGEAYNDKWIELRNEGFAVTFTGTVTGVKIFFQTDDESDLSSFYIDDASWSEMITAPSWKDTANKYIEQYRKRDLDINVTDGMVPINGATIHIKQVKNDFAFGSCIDPGGLSITNYKNFFKTHFNWSVCESASKWPTNEPTQGSVTYTSADNIYDFCNTNGINMRGHCVFWEVEDKIQTWVKNLSDAGLRNALNSRINNAVNHFKGKFLHWDVNNEMQTHFYYRDRLGDTIRPWMFKRVHAVDPNVKLFVNDYENIENDGCRYEDYYRHTADLISQGAPIDAIGCQGHFGEEAVRYDAIYLKLNRLAGLGLPIWITEYDAVDPDANKRADKLEALYRTAFSHPSVKGIIMWGFWADPDYGHWLGANAAIVNQNWTLNAAGERYEDLLAEWTTDETKNTNASGISTFRGFHGHYEITITKAGCTTITDTFSLHESVGKLTLNYNMSCITNVDNFKSEDNFKIYPNPATNNFSIELPTTIKSVSVIIYNTEGMEIIKQTSVTNNNTIDISNLAKGIYFVKLIADNSVEVKKITKE